MAPTYSALAARAVAAAARTPAGAQWWCAIAGGPGAGKSTLAEAVATRCREEHGVEAVVLPMDGFHFSRADLRRLDPPHASAFLPRRGAPHTFDAEGCVAALAGARAAGAGWLPTYSRALSDPVPGGAALETHHRVVLVEGNYLLLGHLAPAPSAPAAQGPIGAAGAAEAAEAARWAPLLGLFDETWFVAPAGGVAEQRARLVGRHLETWTAAKTAAWGAGSAAEGAARRADFNDVPNAKLVDKCQPFADLCIESV